METTVEIGIWPLMDGEEVEKVEIDNIFGFWVAKRMLLRIRIAMFEHMIYKH